MTSKQADKWPTWHVGSSRSGNISRDVHQWRLRKRGLARCYLPLVRSCSLGLACDLWNRASKNKLSLLWWTGLRLTRWRGSTWQSWHITSNWGKKKRLAQVLFCFVLVQTLCMYPNKPPGKNLLRSKQRNCQPMGVRLTINWHVRSILVCLWHGNSGTTCWGWHLQENIQKEKLISCPLINIYLMKCLWFLTMQLFLWISF